MAPLTLDAIRSEPDGAVYPREILADCDDALVLFAAAFHGRQDAVWIADAGIRATCIDIDRDRLDEMARAYPADWLFLEANIYELPAETEPIADLVSVDCPSGHFKRCADLLGLWCSLARKYVVLGSNRTHPLDAPHGWELVDRRRRSSFAGGTYWAVFRRTAA